MPLTQAGAEIALRSATGQWRSPLGWPPQQNNMPSLEHLDTKNILNVMLNALFGERGVPGQPGRPLANYLARLMDKTILAYESARGEMTRYVERPSDNVFSPLFRAQDQLETTIDSLWRVACFTERLRRYKLAPTLDVSRLPLRTDQQRIRQMRHAIQHADEHVFKGRANESWLAVCDDAIELADQRIRYRELAAWIEGYHDVVKQLVAYLPDAATTEPA
jgi:hypothetical protein